MEGLYFETQKIEHELLGNMRPTKALQKEKKHEVHCGFCAPKLYGCIIQPPFHAL